MRLFARIAVFAVFCALAAAAASAETTELRISKQPGLQYLPLLVMEQNRLVEKYAHKLGLGELKISYVTLNSGGTALDALLAGNLDMVSTGVSNLLVAWSGTGGQVKGIAAVGTIPMWLVTKNPNVKTVKDFSAGDKIAVPTVRVSVQSTLLAIAADLNYGQADIHHFDPMTVALGHPDAFIALQSGSGTVNSHFSSPPYQYLEAKLPGGHTVLNSFDLLGGPITSTCVFSSVKFHDANPKTIAAVHSAMNEALELIQRDHRAAALIYLQQSGEKWPLAEIIRELDDKSFVFSEAPFRTMRFADVMYRGGTIKMKANSWKDYFFSEIHNLTGS